MTPLYCLAMNPAIDLFMSLDNLEPSTVNRTSASSYRANGKAVNIARVLQRMDIPSTVLGFAGGFTGQFIQEELTLQHINHNFIKVEGISRINVFIKAQHEYKVMNAGPNIQHSAIQKLMQQLQALPSGAFLFVSGSLPPGIEPSIYNDILLLAQQQSLHVVLDVSDPQILSYLPHRPYLMKPSDEELATFFNVKGPLSLQQSIKYAQHMLQQGLQRILVSRGAQGSFYMDSNHLLIANAAPGKVVNSSCAGDTLLATFMGKVITNSSLDEALRFASASASSTAFTIDLTDFSDVSTLQKHITINRRVSL